MKKLELTEATASLAAYARAASKGAVVLTRSGKPVAALVPIRTADWEAVSLATNAAFLRLIQKSRASLRRRGGLSLEEIERRLEPEVEYARAAARRRRIRPKRR